MSNSGPYYRPEGMDYGRRPRGIHWLPIIIGVVFVGVALVILLVLLYPASFGIASPSNRFGLFGGFFFFFFILIVLFFIVRVAFWSTRSSSYGRRYGRYGGNGRDGHIPPNRPVMVARMRYARGEITREQYDQIMKDLGRPPGPS